MRDAMGGTVSLVIVSVFIVIALGYMAFNVNYTKAFRMKDKIISLYEDFEGDCGGVCQNAIRDYANTLGYSTDNDLNCSNVGSGWTTGVSDLYCVKQVCSISEISNEDSNFIDKSGIVRDRKNKCYYRVVTRINIKLPVISNVFDFRFFYIYGDTKPFEKE
jgi:hypothetical protein